MPLGPPPHSTRGYHLHARHRRCIVLILVEDITHAGDLTKASGCQRGGRMVLELVWGHLGCRMFLCTGAFFHTDPSWKRILRKDVTMDGACGGKLVSADAWGKGLHLSPAANSREKRNTSSVRFLYSWTSCLTIPSKSMGAYNETLMISNPRSSSSFTFGTAESSHPPLVAQELGSRFHYGLILFSSVMSSKPQTSSASCNFTAHTRCS